MKEKVFYNNCLDVYTKDTYCIVNMPHSLPKFKIVLI